MNLNDLSETIFIINMDGHTDRWTNVQQEMAKYSIEKYERIPGVVYDGNKTSLDRDMGCKQAHVNCLLEARRRELEYILVLEDDVFFIVENLASHLEKIKRFITTEDWETFYLGGNPKNLGDNLLETEHEGIVKINRTLTTHSVLFHRTIYDVIIDNLMKEREAVDDTMVKLVQSRGKSFMSMPRLASQRAGHSIIRGGYRSYKRVLED